MAEQCKDGPDEATEATDATRWFVKSFKVPDPAQILLEEYSGLAPDQTIPHVTDLVSGLQLEIRP